MFIVCPGAEVAFLVYSKINKLGLAFWQFTLVSSSGCSLVGGFIRRGPLLMLYQFSLQAALMALAFEFTLSFRQVQYTPARGIVHQFQ